MNKKLLCFGVAISAIAASCEKEKQEPWCTTGKSDLNKTSRINGAQTIQAATLYQGYEDKIINGKITRGFSLDYDFVDALPYCLGGSCGIYTTYKIYLRKNNDTSFVGPYDVSEIARQSNYYYPGQNVYVLRASVPVPKVQTGMMFGQPTYSYIRRTGLYYICLVAPGTTPTLNPLDPTQQLLINYGDDNI